jgi:hypothetical protein
MSERERFYVGYVSSGGICFVLSMHLTQLTLHQSLQKYLQFYKHSMFFMDLS